MSTGMIALADIELTKVSCGECGGTYAVNSGYHEQRRVNGGFWNCPYCKCGWGFDPDGAEVTRLRKEAERERKRREWAEQEAKNSEYRRRAAVGQVTKMKKRVGKGVCPCCSRHFENLSRHMESKHPDYAGG